MDNKDSESGQSQQAEDEKRIETQARHENELSALADPDAGLSPEERAQIVRIRERMYTDSC